MKIVILAQEEPAFMGPTLIEVPQVENVATVDESIEHFYFPPVARRSWIGGASKGFGERGSDRIAYANWWNTYGVLWMQIESIAAVTRSRSLAKSGVDCLSFGPNDLRYSIEAHPHHPFQSVDDCVRHVAEQLYGTSIRVCHRICDPALRNKYRYMGATVATICNSGPILNSAAIYPRCSDTYSGKLRVRIRARSAWDRCGWIASTNLANVCSGVRSVLSISIF